MELELGLDVLRSYKRLPYTHWHALAEFVDNSTQSYFNHRAELDKALAKTGEPFAVRIAYDRNGDGFIRIADNAMGMSEPELQHALRIGVPPADTSGRSKYGLGMKMAACWYGEEWTIRSKRLGSTNEYEITVDVERVAGGETRLPTRVFKDRPIDDHYTTIEMRKLNRKPVGRTIGKIKDFLRSMYRIDISSGAMVLEWDGSPLAWPLDQDESFVPARGGGIFKKEFGFEIDGKPVWGWVGVLNRGSRAKAGFSILHSNRMIKGWPESWRPQTIYGQVEGSNDLVNQRLTGEINLDAFIVNHTKDDIQWMGEEEEGVEEKLREVCSDYRETAKTRRREIRPPTDVDVQVAVEELQAELSSAELVDLLELSVVPEAEVVKEDNAALIAEVDPDAPTLRAVINLARGPLTILGYLDHTMSPNDPYFAGESSRDNEVVILINMSHPHLQQVESNALVNYFRDCVFDAIAEWQARTMAQTTDPGTIKRLKDALLRLRFAIEMH